MVSHSTLPFHRCGDSGLARPQTRRWSRASEGEQRAGAGLRSSGSRSLPAAFHGARPLSAEERKVSEAACVHLWSAGLLSPVRVPKRGFLSLLPKFCNLGNALLCSSREQILILRI